MKNLKLTIGHLYGPWMNTYGDDGNIICLKKRCQWRGIELEVKVIPMLYEIKPKEFDLYFFGGGQDQAQGFVSKDLITSHKRGQLQKDLENGIPMLSICGGYQLLSEYYEPLEGPKIEGLGFFPAYTKASNDRMIGNIVINADSLWQIADSKNKSTISHQPSAIRQLVGFENHSGKTYLKEGAKPLGKVLKGFGNNGKDQTEGCIYKNAIGCYMHGSLLPKNPQLADWLIQKALEVKYGKTIEIKPLKDDLENKAHNYILEKRA